MFLHRGEESSSVGKACELIDERESLKGLAERDGGQGAAEALHGGLELRDSSFDAFPFVVVLRGVECHTDESNELIEAEERCTDGDELPDVHGCGGPT
jgi:hypothetical protein